MEKADRSVEVTKSSENSATSSANQRFSKDTSSSASILSFLKELPILIITAVIVAWIVKSFIVQPFIIPSSSMEPTLYPSDRVLVNKFIYRLRSPQPGDIVVIMPPINTDKDLIKRIVAVGGQTLEIKNGQVILDGKPLEESYQIAGDDTRDLGPIVIPKNSVFLMGDNRPNSYDSRFFGPVKKTELIGKAFSIYWPPARIRILK